MNKIIYRIECAKSGVGPYQTSRISRKEWTTRDHGYEETPDPGYDKKLSAYGELNGWFDGTTSVRHFYFAFLSINSLYEWFTEKELNTLKAKGFVIMAYKLPKDSLIIGSRQVVFTQDKVISKVEVKKMPERKTPHPSEDYVYKEKPWTEAQSTRLMDLMLNRQEESYETA